MEKNILFLEQKNARKNVFWARVGTLGFIGCGSAAETVEPWKT